MSTFRGAIAEACLCADAYDHMDQYADAVLAMPEMRALRMALVGYADIGRSCDDGTYGASRRDDMRLNGVPESIIDWVLDGESS